MRRLAMALVALLAGCAGAPPQIFDRADGEEARCIQAYAAVDRVVVDAAVEDGMAARVPGFPYLRVDRFLASFAGEALQQAAYKAWMERMQTLDLQARRVELANLPAAARASLGQAVEEAGVQALLERCSARLAARDLADPARRSLLGEQARVPDDYQQWKRVLGVYFLTRIPFAAGVRDWQGTTAQTFAADLDSVTLKGKLLRYEPPAKDNPAGAVANLFRRAGTDALGVPEFNAQEQDSLFEAFAPALEIDTAGDDDRIGTVRLDSAGRPRADVSRAAGYRRIAYTRYHGKVLVQLVYSFWFPSRPLDGVFDTLGGHLDGITWRVTLTDRGEAWIFDSMHNCGCYHLFFPAARAAALPPADSLDEQAFVPQSLGTLSPGARLTLRIAARTHYLQRVMQANTAEKPAAEAGHYRYADDDELRSLTTGAGRRSLFDSGGIVGSSARGERFLFWPMGIPNPGAMRQWGRHATAFVGRRHFDEPRLMEKHFRMVPQ